MDTSNKSSDVLKFADVTAREILATQSNGNQHLAEERQQVKQSDKDETNRYSEEMKYSGVYRQKDITEGKKANSYTKMGFQNKTQPVEAVKPKFIIQDKVNSSSSLTETLLSNFLAKKSQSKTLTMPWIEHRGKSLENESKIFKYFRHVI